MKLFNSRPDHKRSLGEPFSGVDGSLAGEQSKPQPSHPLVTGPKERIGRRALVVWYGGSGVSFKRGWGDASPKSPFDSLCKKGCQNKTYQKFNFKTNQS